MRILVTGGAGFIGSTLVHLLLRKEHPEPIECAINLDALTYSGNLRHLADLRKDARHAFVEGSISDEVLVGDLLTRNRIQGVINLAAETHVDRSIDNPDPFVQTNVVGTYRLLETCRQYWSGLSTEDRRAFRFLHVSTDEVYGSLEPGDPPFSETTPYRPHSPYAASKAASDHFVQAYCCTYGLPVLMTNCSNNYGPRQFPEKLIPLMILNALEGRELPIYGDGLQQRDWLYVEDHCRALELVLRQGVPGDIYHVAGGCERTNMELVMTLCEILDGLAPRAAAGKSYRDLITHVTDRPGHDRRYAMTCGKIKRELGWRPMESLATGLEKTVTWYLQNREWSDAITQNVYARTRLGTHLR